MGARSEDPFVPAAGSRVGGRVNHRGQRQDSVRDAGSSAPPKPQELGFLPLHVPPDFFRPLPAEELDAWDR